MDVLGVDFSGAARAGSKLWVAETTVDDAGDGPTVRRCASMADRVGTADRDPCLDALIAAFAVDRARRRGFDPRREYDPVEGHIYL